MVTSTSSDKNTMLFGLVGACTNQASHPYMYLYANFKVPNHFSAPMTEDVVQVKWVQRSTELDSTRQKFGSNVDWGREDLGRYGTVQFVSFPFFSWLHVGSRGVEKQTRVADGWKGYTTQGLCQ